MKSVDMETIFKKISNYNQHSKYYHLEMQFLADQSFFSFIRFQKCVYKNITYLNLLYTSFKCFMRPVPVVLLLLDFTLQLSIKKR